MSALSRLSTGIGLSLSELASWLGLSRTALHKKSRPPRQIRSPRLRLVALLCSEWDRPLSPADDPGPVRDFEPLRKIRQLEAERDHIRLQQRKANRAGVQERLVRILAWCQRVAQLPEAKAMPGFSPKLHGFSEATRKDLMDMEPWEEAYLDLELKQAEEKILFFKGLENQGVLEKLKKK